VPRFIALHAWILYHPLSDAPPAPAFPAMTVLHGHPEPQNPSRVVLLGGGGFLGKALASILGRARIGVLSLGSRDLDLSAPEAMEQLAERLTPSDALVMLAAITPDKGRDRMSLIRNLAMMHAACSAIERAGCAHLVYFSSDAVYGLGLARVSEETLPTPQDLYGTMHLAREAMARGLAGVPVLVLRPTLVYGPGDTHSSYGPNRFRRSAAKEGRIQLFGKGEETRDHIHVDDVSEITLRCLQRRSTGTLNVVTGRSASFREVAALVARHAGRPVEIVATPRANPITHRHYDVTNLLKAFPDYRFVALEEGVARATSVRE
jgi:nucleoside-diphosphate-sugar epimerase